jgi:carbon-monoxide dehydrogenase medium subunit
VTVKAGTITDASVALASVADTAVRSPAVEGALVGESVSQSGLEGASRAVVEDIDPIDDEGGSAAYKREVASTVVQRSLATAVRRAGGSL